MSTHKETARQKLFTHTQDWRQEEESEERRTPREEAKRKEEEERLAVVAKEDHHIGSKPVHPALYTLV